VSKYIGKVCPYCKTPFTEDDEIVICSNCEMPHHKDCWIENTGCTTFGCTGTINSADGSGNTGNSNGMGFDQSQPMSHIFCTRCGAENEVGHAFCSKCGTPISNPMAATSVNNQPSFQNQGYNTQYNQQTPNYGYNNQQTPNYGYNNQQTQNYGYGTQYNQNQGQTYYAQNAVIDRDVVAFVGTNQEYYIPKFQMLKMQNKKTSWNWPAFLFAPYWFVYRKMYGYGFAALAVAFLITLVDVPIISILSLGGYIAVGIFANYIYMLWAESGANRAKGINEPFKTQHLSNMGGVSTTALALTIVGYFIVALLVLLMMNS